MERSRALEGCRVWCPADVGGAAEIVAAQPADRSLPSGSRFPCSLSRGQGEAQTQIKDSGFLVSRICCNTFSALVLVSCASTNITSWAPSMIVEFTQKLSSGDVNTFIDNAGRSLADDGRATTHASPKNNTRFILDLFLPC